MVGTAVKKAALVLALILTVSFLSYILAEKQFVFTASGQYSELVISIRNDGSVDPSTAPLQWNGNAYTLTSDVDCNTIIIQRDNLVFDGANHTIELLGSISITQRENVTVKNTIIKAGLGISLSGSNNKIIGNTFHINATNAIAVSHTGFAVTTGNIISNNTIELKNGFAGVDVFKASDTVISDNTILTAESSSQVFGGITVSSSHNTSVVGNNINAYTTYGIAILGNYLDSSLEGEVLSAVVRANHVTGNYSFGVYSNCPNVDITGNKVTGDLKRNPESYGIMLREDSDNNVVSQNYVLNNGVGICFQPFLNNAVEGILKSKVFENSLVNNNIQAEINMANCSISWDNGGKGNYWSNYNGTDSNDDGIGDIPYIIGGAYKDNYPLMKPVVIPTQIPEPSAESLPATTILAASAVVAIIGIGLFACFKKRY